jgi:tetratricopeptide (TPR) repeat protein
VARLRSGGEVDGIDEEFLFHLSRGSDLLLRGDAETARSALERAEALRPKDSKVLGLLGQTYYKLSRFDDAARVWQRLVDDNPIEPGARVNLGLAFLKARRHLDAVKQLEIAVDLNPEHKKAMGYLGLALLDSGRPSRAREWFRRAGSEQMVARCDELIAAGEEAADEEPAQPLEHAAAGGEEASAAASSEPLATPLPGEEAPHQPAEAGDVLAAWAAARLVRSAPGETFSVADGILAVEARGELRVRLDGLFATQGRLELAPEVKRFRGRPTEQPFGEGSARVHRVSGAGVLLYRTGLRRFNALELGADAAYVREEALFGFEDGVAFENGRVASASSAELNLVHLRGPGRILLATAGEPLAVDVLPDAPLRVPIAALVGWLGALTPRVCALVEDDEAPLVAAVELAGEGRVVVDPSAAEG